MKKYLACGATALLSLGLAARANQTPDAGKGGGVTDEPAKKVVIARVVEGADGGDAAETLREAYDALYKYRYRRLETQPQSLLQRATQIYREGVAAYKADDEPKARAYAEAAKTLSQALDLSLGSAKEAKEDDAVLAPAPPAEEEGDERTYASSTAKFYGQTITLPPELPVELNKIGHEIELQVQGRVDEALKSRMIEVRKDAAGDKPGEAKTFIFTTPVPPVPPVPPTAVTGQQIRSGRGAPVAEYRGLHGPGGEAGRGLRRRSSRRCLPCRRCPRCRPCPPSHLPLLRDAERPPRRAARPRRSAT